MRNTILVIRNEIRTMLAKRSFWLMTLLFPLVIFFISGGAQLLGRSAMDEGDSSFPTEGGVADIPATGYIDQAGVIQRMPPGMPESLFRAYPDENSARAALQSGEVASFYLIPPDYMESGQLVVVVQDFRPFANNSEALIDYLLTYNLSGDAELASLLVNPVARVEEHALQPAPVGGEDELLAVAVPMTTMFIFFLLITSSSGFMLQSVAREKENRTMEVLLVSVKPRELMVGKLIGLSIVALVQLGIWGSASLLLFGRGRQMLDMAAAVRLPPGFFVWAVLYFLLGYILYASMMAAIGALAPTAREGGQFTFFALLPLLIPLWMNPVFAEAPNSATAVALSLFPFSAPTSMMTRLATTQVPGWQLGVSLVGLAVTTWALVLLATRFFRADNLLSGAPLKWRQLLNAWR